MMSDRLSDMAAASGREGQRASTTSSSTTRLSAGIKPLVQTSHGAHSDDEDEGDVAEGVYWRGVHHRESPSEEEY